MDIPYGFDCYAFKKDQIRYFETNLYKPELHPTEILQPKSVQMANQLVDQPRTLSSTDGQTDYVKFTRKNEDYTKEQIIALGKAGRLNMSEIDQRLFCGIKIQIGIGVVTNFLRKGLQYKQPIKGRAELVNGSWTGIVKGLTVDKNAPISYDLAFGNFLAWDEEFPYIKFGPFFAIESKLVMLTGVSRRIELSSFGTNIDKRIWLTLLSLLIILSLLASLWVDWQQTKHQNIEEVINQLAVRYQNKTRTNSRIRGRESLIEASSTNANRKSFLRMLQDFFLIYYTMLLNKPSVEFDDLIWPKQVERWKHIRGSCDFLAKMKRSSTLNDDLSRYYDQITRFRKSKRRKLPTSIRIVSYLWSAVCFVMASIYSGEMLAVMLLHTDQNIDTINQLINSRPPIEPVIRQDDFTHTLMLKSLDENMLKLYNKTRVILRAEVYSRSFIESVSERKYALLGDDELIETIYDIYHKYYPLYKSKMTYLQYPISIMYRKDLNVTLERKLRRGMVQMFEMGLIHRWYQAQKDTYIQFYDTYERKAQESKEKDKKQTTPSSSEEKYKPLSMHHFRSFFRAMMYCFIFAFIVLILELLSDRIRVKTAPI